MIKERLSKFTCVQGEAHINDLIIDESTLMMLVGDEFVEVDDDFKARIADVIDGSLPRQLEAWFEEGNLNFYVGLSRFCCQARRE